MIDQRNLDPDAELLMVARSPDGPTLRVRVGDLRALFDAGLLEPGPNGGIQISDKGLAYGRAHRDA